MLYHHVVFCNSFFRECGNENFAWRDSCNKCKAVRKDGGGGGGGGELIYYLVPVYWILWVRFASH